MDRRRPSQLSGVGKSSFLLFVLLHVLNDLGFDLREVTADPILVQIVKRLCLRIRHARHFCADLRIEQRAGSDAFLLCFLREQRIINFQIEVLLTKCIDLFLNIENQRTEAVLDITQPPNSESAGKVVAADFFDERWQVISRVKSPTAKE